MTRNSVVAEILYAVAVNLKKYGASDLLRDKNRTSLIRTLSAMQYLVQCIGMKKIPNSRIDDIINICEQILGELSEPYKVDLENAEVPADYSEEYYDLLLKMNGMLFSCVNELTERKKGYEKSVHRYIMGFHNLPRAFLAFSDVSRISVREAWEYCESYLRLGLD